MSVMSVKITINYGNIKQTSWNTFSGHWVNWVFNRFIDHVSFLSLNLNLSKTQSEDKILFFWLWLFLTSLNLFYVLHKLVVKAQCLLSVVSSLVFPYFPSCMNKGSRGRGLLCCTYCKLPWGKFVVLVVELCK